MASAMLSKLSKIFSLKLTHLRSPSRQFVSGFLLGIGFSLILLAVLFVSESPTTEEQEFITVGVNPLCGDSCSSSDDAIASKMLDSVTNDHVEPVQVVNTTEPVLQQLVNTTEPVLVETGLNITEQTKDETIAAEEENAASKDLDADNSVVQVIQEESVPTKDDNSSSNAEGEGEGEALGTAYLPNSSVAYQLPSWVVKYFGKALPPFSVSVKEALPPLGVSVREEALPHFGVPVEEALPPVHAEEKVEMVESIVSENSTIVDNKFTKKETAVTERPGDSKEKITNYGFPHVFGKQSDPTQKCDIYQGKWVKDKSMPFYPGGSCSLIDENFDCYGNGRPDTGFLKWRWQPFGCKIPRLNPIDFLERLRGKRLVYMGDSLNRNMWESMVCILRHGVQDKNKVYEVSGRREFKKRGPGMYSFIFEEYNCSVDFVWSPFLVSKSTFPGKNASFETLKLDLMDPSAAKIQDADIIVFNTALWWVHFKTKSGINFYQEGNRVYPRLKAQEAYRRALKTWATWVDNNINVNRTRIFFRGMTSTHYGGGKMRAERFCHKQTKPITKERYLAKYSSKMRMVEKVLHGMNTPVTYINISRLTNYRRDGHSAIYRRKHKTKQEELAESPDCTHWCLPGVPDTWNELLYASLLHPEWGSSI